MTAHHNIYVSKRWFDRLSRYVPAEETERIRKLSAVQTADHYVCPRAYIEEYYRRHCCLRFRHVMLTEFPFLKHES